MICVKAFPGWNSFGAPQRLRHLRRDSQASGQGARVHRGKERDGVVALVLRRSRQAVAGQEGLDAGLRDVLEGRRHLFPVGNEAKTFMRHAKFREAPLLNPLSTPTGLIEIYSKNIEKMGYDDCRPHPTWMEPLERWSDEPGKYPLHVVSAHPIGRLHSQSARYEAQCHLPHRGPNLA
jgi:hypothetical protein